MTEMVERIARAIYDAPNGIDGDQIAEMLIEDFRISSVFPAENFEKVLAVCRQAARAAIEAISDPTEAMLDRGALAALTTGTLLTTVQVHDIWQAMNDEALTD